MLTYKKILLTSILVTVSLQGKMKFIEPVERGGYEVKKAVAINMNNTVVNQSMIRKEKSSIKRNKISIRKLMKQQERNKISIRKLMKQQERNNKIVHYNNGTNIMPTFKKFKIHSDVLEMAK